MTLRPRAKGEQRRVAGESARFGTPPLSRISDEGLEGGGSTGERTRDIRQGIGDSQLDDAGRRAITISTILAGSGVRMKAMTSTEERVGPTPQEEKDMSPEEEQQSSIADDLVRRSALHAFIPESPGGTSTETIGIPASCDVSPAQESVLFQGEQPRMHSLEELMEELKEEPRVGSVDQQKENIEDLSSVIITTATSEEPRKIDHDQMHDLDDIHGLLDEINSITLDDPKDDYLLESGGDQGGYPTGSSWGHTPHTTLWNSSDMDAITGFVIDSEDLASLLSSRSDGWLGRDSYNKEELAHSLWTGEYDHESSPNVDADPPKGSVYDPVSEGEATAITEVIAGSDVK